MDNIRLWVKTCDGHPYILSSAPFSFFLKKKTNDSFHPEVLKYQNLDPLSHKCLTSGFSIFTFFGTQNAVRSTVAGSDLLRRGLSPGNQVIGIGPTCLSLYSSPRYRPTCPLPKSSILSLYFPDRGPTCPEEYDLQTHPRPSSLPHHHSCPNASYHHGSSCRNSLSREAPSPRQGGKTKLD